jgi:hypothetical protein
MERIFAKWISRRAFLGTMAAGLAAINSNEASADDPFFAGRKIEEREGCGRRWQFPIRYYDLTMISASFPAPVAAVQKILPTGALKPVQLMPDLAVVNLVAFEYHHIDQLAPYNEFMVAVPVLYKTSDQGPGLPGGYVFHLPVSTEEARCAGVELYGFPKFLAEITFEDASQARSCGVRADGRGIISLEVKKTDTKKTQLPDAYPYTVKNSQLLRTRTQWQAQAGIAEVKGGASFTLGDHRIAEQLRALELGKASVRHLYATQGQAMLHLPGEPLPL